MIDMVRSCQVPVIYFWFCCNIGVSCQGDRVMFSLSVIDILTYLTCPVLWCTVIYCTLLYSIILYCTKMYCVSPVRSQLGLTVRHVGRESHEAARARLVPGLQQGWREFGESPPVQGVVLVVTGVTGSVPRAHGECIETLAAYKCQHLNREERRASNGSNYSHQSW